MDLIIPRLDSCVQPFFYTWLKLSRENEILKLVQLHVSEVDGMNNETRERALVLGLQAFNEPSHISFLDVFKFTPYVFMLWDKNSRIRIITSG